MISELILLIAIAFSVGWCTLIFLRQKKTDRQANRQTNKQTKQQRDKQTNEQTDRQTAHNILVDYFFTASRLIVRCNSYPCNL